VIERRRSRVTDLVELLTAARAEERLGSRVEVLVEEVTDGLARGCAAHQQPEVDGSCVVRLPAGGVAGPAPGDLAVGLGRVEVGDLVEARVVATEGVDLIAEFTAVLDRARPAAVPPTPRRGAPDLEPVPAGRGVADGT
jgi:hypothetical protein